MAITGKNQAVTLSSLSARLFWYLECWGLKRIDAWGVTYVITASVLVIHDALRLQTWLLVTAVTANYWLGYWLNDYFDAGHDSQDEHKARQNLFVQQPGARRLVLIVAGAVFGISALVFLSFGWRGMLVLLMNFLVMWAYSAPPLRLKSRPGLDLLTHALFVQTWPYFICMWLTGSIWTPFDGILLGILFLSSLSGQLNQQVRDFEVDSRTDTNFATRVGLAKTMLLLKVCASAALVLGALALINGSVPWHFLPLGLLALPKTAHQIRHRLHRTDRTFPRRLLYISMSLALLYTSMLMLLEWTL